ncbi:MFS general substrate transporter [Poronia punctata]|nr:MFS general substrate transporter [Poronia punctata]
METNLLHGLVKVESNSLPQPPSRVASRTHPAAPVHDEEIKLKRLNTTSVPSRPPTLSGDEVDPERGTPTSPSAEPTADAFQVLPSLMNPGKNKFRFVGCCLQVLLGGLLDSAAGALIPYMEKHYNIGYAVVSLIFVGNALGFVAAAPLVDTVRSHLGRSKTLFLNMSIMVLGFVPFLFPAPFPVIVVAYFFLGLGFAGNLAIANVFTANLQNGTVLLGGMHGSYGIGGIVGPLVATSIVTRFGGEQWFRYYLIPLAVSIFTGFWFLWSFWGYEEEITAQEGPTTTATTSETTHIEFRAMLQAFKSRVVLLGATFIFAYQGAEVSISGWTISYLITTRGGDPAAVGNVTSGFWGGITLGRFFLSPIGARVGEKRFVYGLTAGAAAFQLLVWFVPNIIGEAVSLAIVGLLLGPVYPCAMSVFTRSLSRGEQVSGLSVTSAFGSSGGAVAPFTTGLLAQAVGTFVLHPIAIGLFGAMIACWFALPSPRKRAE